MNLYGRRRVIAKKKSLLPSEYQQVEYLHRNSTLAGPYCPVNASLSINDKILLIAEQDSSASPNEQSPIGTPSYFEIYYENNEINVWPDTQVTTISIIYGPPDTIIAKVISGSLYILNWIGNYRTGTYRFDGKIYRVTITDANDNKKYDYIPCYRKADQKPGFYETVNGVFYTNAAMDGSEWGLPT